MKPALTASLAAILALLSAPAVAELATSPRGDARAAPGSADGAPLQCVPYARQVSGIRIFGDAHTWWDQAEGKYARGHAPRVGAVMAFVPHRNMVLGHVAAVSRVIDARTVLIRHSNWSEIGGRRGQIEDDVRAVDVSAAGDWSQVRVWYAPSGALGTTAWPVRGFIYPAAAPAMRAPAGNAARAVVAASTPPRAAPTAAPRATPTAAPAAAPRAAPRAAPARRDADFAASMAMDDLVAEDSFEGSFAGLR